MRLSTKQGNKKTVKPSKKTTNGRKKRGTGPPQTEEEKLNSASI